MKASSPRRLTSSASFDTQGTGSRVLGFCRMFRPLFFPFAVDIGKGLFVDDHFAPQLHLLQSDGGEIGTKRYRTHASGVVGDLFAGGAIATGGSSTRISFSYKESNASTVKFGFHM